MSVFGCQLFDEKEHFESKSCVKHNSIKSVPKIRFTIIPKPGKLMRVIIAHFQKHEKTAKHTLHLKHKKYRKIARKSKLSDKCVNRRIIRYHEERVVGERRDDKI